MMTKKTEIKIEGDSIIYNGVKYEKVKTVPSDKPNLQYILADKLERLVNEMYIDYTDICCNVDVIVHELIGEMSQHIPDYSDWEGAWDELPEESRPQNGRVFFRCGWNAYCKKMWDMINDD